MHEYMCVYLIDHHPPHPVGIFRDNKSKWVNNEWKMNERDHLVGGEVLYEKHSQGVEVQASGKNSSE